MQHFAAQVIRRVVVAALAAMVAVVTLEAPAIAKPDRGLCSYTEARGKIPDSFPIPACFDGKYLVVVNTMAFPITITASGGGKPIWARMNGASAADHALAIMFSKYLELMPPNYKARIPIGAGASKVKLGRAPDHIHKTYVLMEVFWQYVPFGPAEMPRAAFDLLSELVKVGDEYVTCIRRNGYWGDLGCTALLTRNVSFAFARAAINVVSGGMARLVQALMNMLTSQKWALASIQDDKALKASGEFTINAAPKPPPPPPSPTGNGGKTGGNTSGNTGGNTGGAGNNPAPPPPPPPPSTAVITVQNMVLNGPTQLREDSTPAYLSTSMQPYCKSRGCAVPGTDMWSGYRLTVRCWANGAQMTNQNTNDPSDDNNPYLWTSTVWYMGIWPDGRQGYLTEIYIAPEYRGGMGLPRC